MRIVWSDDAIESVDNTADYIEDNFGVNRSMEFYDEVQEQADSLLQFPRKGPIDEDLKGGKYEYRSFGGWRLEPVDLSYRWRDNSYLVPLEHATQPHHSSKDV